MSNYVLQIFLALPQRWQILLIFVLITGFGLGCIPVINLVINALVRFVAWLRDFWQEWVKAYRTVKSAREAWERKTDEALERQMTEIEIKRLKMELQEGMKGRHIDKRV